MMRGRIIGTVVATVKSPGLEGVPMLLVQPQDKAGRDAGEPLVAADATRQAGIGDQVYFEGGREAAMALPETFVPVDHAVIGIVDGVYLDPSDEKGGKKR